MKNAISALYRLHTFTYDETYVPQTRYRINSCKVFSKITLKFALNFPKIRNHGVNQHGSCSELPLFRKIVRLYYMYFCSLTLKLTYEDGIHRNVYFVQKKIIHWGPVLFMPGDWSIFFTINEICYRADYTECYTFSRASATIRCTLNSLWLILCELVLWMMIFEAWAFQKILFQKVFKKIFFGFFIQLIFLPFSEWWITWVYCFPIKLWCENHFPNLGRRFLWTNFFGLSKFGIHLPFLPKYRNKTPPFILFWWIT